ncbi:MAG: hypothetical protein U9R58_02765 [Chloroflexota bacterium]|nr:hypothetical protein [Chloroflexota bacterium]
MDDSDGVDQSIKWTMFLGNPATTTRTIRDTLRLVNQEGLAGQFNGCSIIKNMRVFDYEMLSDATLDVAYSVTPDLERTGYQQLLPSFAYPPALLKHFGSEELVVTMFEHIQETYLSTRYQETRDWNGFVRRNGTAAEIAGWMEELSDLKSVQLPGHLAGFSSGKANAALEDVCSDNPPDGEGFSNEDLPQQIVDWLLSTCLDTFPDLFAALGLPETMEKLERMTSHELAVVVFTRWSTEGELLNELDRQARSTLSESMLDFVRFCVQVVLYRFSVLIEPKYRALIVSTELQK